MKPIIKYQGGKTRELSIIKKLAPTEFNHIIEPFAGGAAVSFAYEKPSVLCDINEALVNLYRMVQQPMMFHDIFSHVAWLKTLDHNDLEKEYYKARDYINGNERDGYTYAISYIVLRQLCFSGMERYNNDGKFNVPFGHYQKFSCSLDENHMKHLKECVVLDGDFNQAFDDATADDWIFIDPPYRDRLGYTQGDGGEDLHDQLVDRMVSTQGKWLFIHTECDYYKDKLSDYHIITKPFGYGQRFGKGRNHANASVSHMYVTNYENDMTLHYAAQPTLLEICNNT